MEERILLSKIIKSQHIIQEQLKSKKIEIKSFSSDVIDENEQEGIEEKTELELYTLKIEEAKQELQLLANELEEMKFQAYQEIQHHRQQWEEEKKRAMEQVKQEGFQQGYMEGQGKGYIEYATIIHSARDVVDLARKDYENLIQSSEEDLLKLSVGIAERILAVRLMENKEQFVPIVKRVLKTVKEHQDIQIRVHPTQYPYIIKQKNELEGILLGESKLYIYPDEELQEFGCTIESSYGKVDASIDTQLHEIRLKLLAIAEEDNQDESS